MKRQGIYIIRRDIYFLPQIENRVCVRRLSISNFVPLRGAGRSAVETILYVSNGRIAVFRKTRAIRIHTISCKIMMHDALSSETVFNGIVIANVAEATNSSRRRGARPIFIATLRTRGCVYIRKRKKSQLPARRMHVS